MNKQADMAGKWIRRFYPIVTVQVVLGAWLLFLMTTHYLRPVDGALYSVGSVWGDLPWHLTLVMGFAERGFSAFAENPIFYGARLSYPFVAEIPPALLVRGGMDLRAVMVLSSWPVAMAALGLLSWLCYRVTRHVWYAAAIPLLFCLNGSVVGTWNFVRDVATGKGDWLSLALQQGTSYANRIGEGLVFTNVIADFLLPQRTFVYGLAIGLLALWMLWSYWETGNRRHLFVSAIVIGSLPLVHTHSFVALGIISGTLAGTDVILSSIGNRAHGMATLRAWAWHAGLLLCSAAIPLMLILPDVGSGFLRWQVGWMAKGNILPFYLYNLGIYALLIPAALFVVLRSEWHARTAAGKRRYPFSTFFTGFAAVFVAANLVVFQPWDWDNMKLLLWAFIGSLLLLFRALSLLPRLTTPVRGALVIVLCLAMTTGVLANIRESGPGSMLFSVEDRGLAAFIREHTPKDALFLTSERHNHPASALSGRQIVAGYGGWLWSHGVDPAARQSDVTAMYAGTSRSEGLLSQYGIDYVVIERAALPTTNLAFFGRRFEVVFENGDYMLYRVAQTP